MLRLVGAIFVPLNPSRGTAPKLMDFGQSRQ